MLLTKCLNMFTKFREIAPKTPSCVPVFLASWRISGALKR